MPKALDNDAEELRAETNYLLRRSNITKEENKALKELREDQDRMVLTTDKGVAMVVLDRKEYMDKVEGLLTQLAYKAITTDPTNKLKAKLKQKFKRTKRETNMGEGIYKAMYLTGCTAPRYYGLPEIHKTRTSIRPIVSSRGSVTYGWLKSLLRYLKPL